MYRRPVRFHVLGPLEVVEADGPISLGGPKQRVVLAHLVLGVNQVVPAERLIDAVWGEDLPDEPRATLRVYVSRLRSALEQDTIEGRPPGYVLHADPEDVDAFRFEVLLREARRGTVDPRKTVDILDEALELWRGPALADLSAQPSLSAEIARLEELHLQANEEKVSAQLALGGHADVIGELNSLTAAHPLRERLWALLMLALYRSVRQADALDAYQRAREVLADELGIDPTPELQELQDRILRHEPSLDLDGRPLRGYRLLETIGQGSFGVVHRAIQPHLGREVAVKSIDPELANDPEFVRRFESEAQVIARLENPHIVPLYDYWREPGGAYLVMPYLSEGSLRRRLQEERSIPPSELAGFVDQVAQALSTAHRQGIVHRDVKPENVLLDAEGNAYLTDFGIAKDASDPTEDTSGPLGTPTGLSPEQIRGEAVTLRTDVYALGVLIYEMLTGLQPFPDGSIAASLQRSADEPFPSVLGADPRLPAAIDSVLARATARDPSARFGDALELAAAFRESIGPSVGHGAAVTERQNPYKGLRPFVEADASDFFGREALIERLVSRLDEDLEASRFLSVVGPSGSGKSSVVRAGLIPALRRGALGGSSNWFYVEMTPGAHPLEELETALLRVAVHAPASLLEQLEQGDRGLHDAVEQTLAAGSELVIVIDQLEEVFTLVEAEAERRRFLDIVRFAVTAPDARVRIVTTLRADFYDRPLAYRGFAELVHSRSESVVPLSPRELERAIAGPAENAAVEVEAALIAEIVADVAEEPGALPMLQYALTELFEHRSGGVLSAHAYREIGGVSGALARRAEQLFDAMNPAGKQAAKQLFLRLVTLGEGTEDTRRRVARSELDRLGVGDRALDGVIEAFVRHRLLSLDRDPETREPTVEIAHEALLRRWSRMRRWIDEGRDDMRAERRLAAAAAEWEAGGRDPSFLLGGSRLEQLSTWATGTNLALAQPEREFLTESAERAEAERAAEDVRRSHEISLERRSVRRLRGLVAAVTAAAVVAGTLTVIAVGQRNSAQRQSQVATARELTAAALTNLEVDPERSILLAMRAVELSRSNGEAIPPEVEEALHRAVVASRIVLSVPGMGGELDWAPTGDVFAAERSDGSGVIDIGEVETGRRIGSLPGHDGDITGVAFSPDGSMLASTGSDGLLKLWDPEDGKLLEKVSGVGVARGPSFGHDGTLVAAAWPDEATVRVAGTSTDLMRSFKGLRGATGTSFDPGGARIAVSTELLRPDSTSGLLFVLDLQDGRRRVLPSQGAPVIDVAWSPDGDLVAAGNNEPRLTIWDATTGRLRYNLPGHTNSITSVDWLSDSKRRVLVTGGLDGTARVWTIGKAGATETMTLSSQVMTSITDVAFSPDGTRVMAGSGPPASGIRIWDVSPLGGAEWANLPADPIGPEAVFQSARRVLASGGRGSVILWNIEAAAAPHTVRRFDVPGYTDCCANNIDVSADGATVAIDTWNAGMSVRDVATGDELFSVPIWLHPMDLSQDGRYFAVEAGGVIRILDRSGRDIGTRLREGDGFRVGAVLFAPDSRFIATLSHRGAEQRVRIWDRERGIVVTEITDAGYRGRGDIHFSNLAFDPSGRLIATTVNRQVRIWNVESGTPVATLPAQPGEIGYVVFSPDGATVATGASDGAVRLFDLDAQAQRLVLQAPHSVGSVSFSADGSLFASLDGTTVRVWALDIDDLLQIARQSVTRSLTDDECRQYLHQTSCSAATAAAA
jgi:serine/threonine protein kinase/WD40 repeat protein